MTVTPLAPHSAAAGTAATSTSSPAHPTTTSAGTAPSVRRRQRKPAHERAAIRAARTSERLAASATSTSSCAVEPSAVAVRGTFEANRRGFGFLRLTPGPRNPAGVESIFVPRHLSLGLLAGDELCAHATCTRGRWQLIAVDAVQHLPLTVVARLGATAEEPARVEPEFGHAFVRVPDEIAAAYPSWPAGRRVMATVTAHTQTATGLGQSEPAQVSAFKVLGDPMTPAELREVTFATHGVALRAPWEELPATLAAPPSTPTLTSIPTSAQGRVNLTKVPTFTIDGASSRDLDDAISAHPVADGIRVQVHIADVAAAVALNSPLDLAAREAATSVYLPGWNRPMLPRELSEDALSLLPHQIRETLTISYTVTEHGIVKDIDLAPTRIRSDRRMSYTEASDIVGRFAESTPTDAVIVSLMAAHAAATALGSQRLGRSTLGDRPRPTPDWQPTLRPTLRPTEGTDGHASLVEKDPYTQAAFTRGEAKPATPADTLIERLMVAANEAVATWLLERRLPGIFRTHADPGPALVADITACVSTLPPALRRAWTQERAFVELHATLDQTAEASPMKLLAEFAALDPGRDHQALVEQLWFRHLRKAQYQTTVAGHHGLGSSGYTHFTSPIRRYADLAVHHVIHAHLAADAARLCDIRQVLDAGLCTHLNHRNQQASRIERDVVSYATRQLLTHPTAAGEGGGPAAELSQPGHPAHASNDAPTLRGIVIGVSAEGVEIDLPQVGLRASVAAADLGAEHKFYTHGLFAKNLRTGAMLRLGSLLEVSVTTSSDADSLHVVPVRQRARRRSRRAGTRRP